MNIRQQARHDEAHDLSRASRKVTDPIWLIALSCEDLEPTGGIVLGTALAALPRLGEANGVLGLAIRFSPKEERWLLGGFVQVMAPRPMLSCGDMVKLQSSEWIDDNWVHWKFLAKGPVESSAYPVYGPSICGSSELAWQLAAELKSPTANREDVLEKLYSMGQDAAGVAPLLFFESGGFDSTLTRSLSNSDTSVRTAATGGAGSFSNRKDAKMQAHQVEAQSIQVSQWRQDLDSYPDRVALTFEDREGLSRFIARLWDRSDVLFGLPRGYADSRTLVVPKDALELARESGSTFAVHSVKI